MNSKISWDYPEVPAITSTSPSHGLPANLMDSIHDAVAVDFLAQDFWDLSSFYSRLKWFLG